MNTDEQFDDLLRDKFNDDNIEFNEMHWQQAEQLIVAKERKDRNRKVAVWFLSCAILVSGLFVWNSMSENRNILTDDKSSSKNVATKNKIKSVDEKNSSATNNKGEFREDYQSNLSERNSKIQNPKAEDKSINENLNSKTESKSNLTLIVSPSKKKSHSKKLNNANVMVSETGLIASENNLSINSKNYADERSNTIAEENSIQNEILITGNITPSIQESSIGETQTVAKDSSAQSSELLTKQITPEKQIFPKTSYYISGGAFMSKAFNNGDGWAINPIGGVAVMLQFNQNWSLELNGVYFEKGKVNSSKNFHSEYYSGEFGKRNEDVVINSIKLQYIGIPVILQYHFNNNNQLIEAGMSYNYLLNAHSKVETNSQFTGSALTSSTEKKQGYVNGFEKSDYAIIIGYTHLLAKNLNVGIRLNYGLTDVAKNAYYNNSSKDKIIGMQLFLKYKLK